MLFPSGESSLFLDQGFSSVGFRGENVVPFLITLLSYLKASRVPDMAADFPTLGGSQPVTRGASGGANQGEGLPDLILPLEFVQQ